MIAPRVRVDTPRPCHPESLLAALEQLVAPLPPSDRISAGFPGVVRDGHILTAPHFDGPGWSNYALAQALSERFGKPARVLNDAEVQGLGIVTGKGLEVVLTLGTGIGSAIFSNGRLRHISNSLITRYTRMKRTTSISVRPPGKLTAARNGIAAFAI